MPINNTGKNSMLDHFGTELLYLSLHNVDAPTDNTTEITGGSPAYARKAITWGAAASGSMSATNQPVFDVPACTIKSIGLWSASSGGTFYGYYDITDEVFAAQGTYTVSSCVIDLNK